MQYLAADIGASSGRHIVGSLQDGRIELTEVYRFDNGCAMQNGHLCWDLEGLRFHLLEGIKAAKAAMPVSFGVDTWGVDFVLLDEKDELLGDAVAYRDSRTQGMDKELEKRLPFSRHYALAGIAKQPFNTVYQLMSLPQEVLQKARTFLMMPDYLHFFLTGKKCNEYTNASTTAMLDAKTRGWCEAILRAAKVPLDLLKAPILMPGTVLGHFSPMIRQAVGFPCRVVLPATHDTGSAFMAIPAKDESAVYLSSGTWSLLGVEMNAPLTDDSSRSAGFTNEGGFGGSIRYLKNIMGLWILQCIRREQGKRHTFAQMAEMAAESAGFTSCFDANAPRFLAPESMIREIHAALRESGQPLPQTDGELYACVYHSLAQCYQQAVHQLESLVGKRFTSMNIVGGGSQNRVLNQWTANALRIPVLAGPAEGTALGNLVAQMLAAGELADLQEAREVIRRSFEIETYLPQ